MNNELSVKIKCATFDKEMQDAIPEHVKAKMKADREKANRKWDENIRQMKAQLKGRYEA
jgi:hypothetical protein